MNEELLPSFRQTCVNHLNENLSRIKICFNEIIETSLWHSANIHSNSIGNFILHLNGNITQYILSSLGKETDHRNRDAEFKTKGHIDKSALILAHEKVILRAIEIISNISEEELLKNRFVQGFDLNGLQIIIHVVEHYSYHTGQIAYIVKTMKDKDLGFYKDMDLNIRNSNN